MSQARPDPPVFLADEAERWNGLCRDLIALRGGAYDPDFAALAQLLKAERRLAEVQDALDAAGVSERSHRLLALELTLRRQVSSGWDRLGLGPDNRWRTQTDADGRLRSLR